MHQATVSEIAVSCLAPRASATNDIAIARIYADDGEGGTNQTYREAQTLERAALRPACPREASQTRQVTGELVAHRRPMRSEVVRSALSPFS